MDKSLTPTFHILSKRYPHANGTRELTAVRTHIARVGADQRQQSHHNALGCGDRLPL
jgi:hypothetical protein